MPKIIRSTEFRLSAGKQLNQLFSGSDPFVIIANETYFNKTFAIVKPDALVSLLLANNRTGEAMEVTNALVEIKKKISDKYKGIRGSK